MKAVLLLALLGSHTLISMAAPDKDKELQHVQTKIKTVSDNLSRLKKQASQASSELQDIEQQYGKISLAIKSLTTRIQHKQQRIDEIHKEIQLQKKWLATQKKHLAGQVKAAYALGGQEQLKLLLNQQDASRSSRMMTYYRYFNQARLNKLERINTSLHLLSSLEQEKQQEKQQVEVLLTDKKGRQTQLTETKKKRKTVLARVKKDYQKNSSELSRLKKNEKQLKQLVSSLQKNTQNFALPEKPGLPFHRLKGNLPWPVEGKITHTFGSRRSGSQWNGVLISAKEGTQIKAIAHGQVIFSDWFKGYGLLVIVKHDKSYMSLYAFNQSLHKEVGDWVESGDILATVGESGGRDKAGLYFEIREQDKPLNPAEWCRKKR